MPDAIVYCDQCMRMILPSDIKAGDALVTKHGGICLECLNSLSPDEKESLKLQASGIALAPPKPVSSARNVAVSSSRKPGSSAHHRAIKHLKSPISTTMSRVAASGMGPATKPPTGQHKVKRTGMHIPVRKRNVSSNMVVLFAAIGAGALVSGIVLLLAAGGGDGSSSSQKTNTKPPLRVEDPPDPPPTSPEDPPVVVKVPAESPTHTLSRFLGASHGYAFRRLSSTYSGPCIRVRRGADDREDDIALSGDSLDTGYLLGFVGQGDGFVVKWYDQSGNGNDLSQNDSSKQPIIVKRGILVQDDDGNPAMRFDGGGLGLSKNSPRFAFAENACSCFVVHNLPETFESGYPLLGKGGFGWTVEEKSHRFRTGSEGWRGAERADKSGRQVASLVRNVSLVMQFYDDGEPQGTIIGTAGDGDLDAVGDGDYRRHGGLIYEVIFFDSDQTSQRSDIETALLEAYASRKTIVQRRDPEADAVRRERRREIDEGAKQDRAQIEELSKDAKYAEAILAAQKALERVGDDVVHRTTFNRIIEELIEQRAAAETQRTAEIEEAEREAKLTEAKLAIEESRFGDAEAALELARKAGADVTDLMGEVQFRKLVAKADEAAAQGSEAEAVGLYRKALDAKDDPDVRARLGDFAKSMRIAKWRDEIAESIRMQDAKTARATLRLYLKEAEGAMAEKGQELRVRIEALEKADSLVSDAREASRRARWPAALRAGERALEVFPEHKAAEAIVQKAKDAVGNPADRITNVLGMGLKLVPGGFVLMGSDDGGKGERPAHKVEIEAFYIGIHEVTNIEFERFDAEHRSKRDKTSREDADPAVNVSYEDATGFCRWISNKENVKYRLPTEAEWERAARGDDQRLYPWGDEAPISGRTAKANLYAGARNAWKRDNALYTAIVGSYASGASPFGIMDMAGNAAEWCADWYQRDYYEKSPGANPTGPERGKLRVVRGGSYESRAEELRCFARAYLAPRARVPTVGFRIVRELFAK